MVDLGPLGLCCPNCGGSCPTPCAHRAVPPWRPDHDLISATRVSAREAANFKAKLQAIVAGADVLDALTADDKRWLHSYGWDGHLPP